MTTQEFRHSIKRYVVKKIAEINSETDSIRLLQLRISLVQIIGSLFSCGYWERGVDIITPLDLRNMRLFDEDENLRNYNDPKAQRVESSQLQYWIGLFAISQILKWRMVLNNPERIRTIKLLEVNIAETHAKNHTDREEGILHALMSWLRSFDGLDNVTTINAPLPQRKFPRY